MRLAEAIQAVPTEDQDLFTLLTEIYGQKFTGMVILYCFEGVPKRAEFPGQQVRLTSGNGTTLDNAPRLP